MCDLFLSPRDFYSAFQASLRRGFSKIHSRHKFRNFKIRKGHEIIIEKAKLDIYFLVGHLLLKSNFKKHFPF